MIDLIYHILIFIILEGIGQNKGILERQMNERKWVKLSKLEKYEPELNTDFLTVHNKNYGVRIFNALCLILDTSTKFRYKKLHFLQ